MGIIRPTDGQAIARVTLGDEEDTRHAIAAAKRAFVTYGRSTTEERAKMLRRLHEAATARIDDLTAAMVEEYGGVVQLARLIVQSGINAFAAAEQALGNTVDAPVGQDDGDHGTGWRCRFDNSVECRALCAVSWPRLSPQVVRSSLSQVVELAAETGRKPIRHCAKLASRRVS